MGAMEEEKPSMPRAEMPEKGATVSEARDEDVVTFKTWLVIFVRLAGAPSNCSTDGGQVLSASYGLSFWVVTNLSSIQTQLATQLGNAQNAAWWVTMSVAQHVLVLP